MAKVLVVEDNRELASMINDWLVFEHYEVEFAYTGSDGMEMLQHYLYDAIILDWELPNKSGIEICRDFRSSGKMTPILMLTGKSEIDDKEMGLDAGADDYLTKPFHMKELGARLRAIIRRSANAPSNVLKAGDIELNPTTFEVTKGGAPIDLLKREFALLEFFMRNPNRVFSAEALLDRVWTSESDATAEALRTTLGRLRKKIDTPKADSLIKTVHGVGYKLQP
ncbi:MAG TPA: response regulator transcription factor [Trichormus sp.]|jgi:DNA-binding response OmpR family regulator